MILPGKGLGVESVEAGSPAELAGLRPGMVIMSCNGVALVDEATVAEAIAASGGTLRLEILRAQEAEPVTVSVAMRRVAAVKF
jgi:S1-C subfamily serine protease